MKMICDRNLAEGMVRAPEICKPVGNGHSEECLKDGYDLNYGNNCLFANGENPCCPGSVPIKGGDR